MRRAIGALGLEHLQRRARKLAAHVPAWARHPTAKALYACSLAVRKAARLANRIEIPWDELQQLFLQTSIAVDERVPCPYCGKQATLCEIELLKTYCFGCSDWGMPPHPEQEGPPS